LIYENEEEINVIRKLVKVRIARAKEKGKELVGNWKRYFCYLKCIKK